MRSSCSVLLTASAYSSTLATSHSSTVYSSSNPISTATGSGTSVIRLPVQVAEELEWKNFVVTFNGNYVSQAPCALLLGAATLTALASVRPCAENALAVTQTTVRDNVGLVG
jgi:hypothetical protein